MVGKGIVPLEEGAWQTRGQFDCKEVRETAKEESKPSHERPRSSASGCK